MIAEWMALVGICSGSRGSRYGRCTPSRDCGPVMLAQTVSMSYIDGVTTHTYSLTRTSRAFNRDWTNFDAETYGVRCSCGIESGCSYLTVEEAHREPLHLFADHRRTMLPRATFDGRIIDRH